jgi:4-carboxymuconolactone decarboxylase
MSNSEQLHKGQELLEKLQGEEVRREIFSLMARVFPDFWKMTQEHLYGDIWLRPKLSVRERMMITLGALTVLVCTDELKAHMRYALNIGISQEEILEVIMHVMHYGGWPTGANAAFAAEDVFFPEE